MICLFSYNRRVRVRISYRLSQLSSVLNIYNCRGLPTSMTAPVLKKNTRLVARISTKKRRN